MTHSRPGTEPLTVLLPAHNEAATIALAIKSLQDQTSPPERIMVVADNCSDNTVRIALDCGAEVFTTVGNTDKKAGGLNQALRKLLPIAGADDLFMIMDADTVLEEAFIATARAELVADPDLGAVGGLFLGEKGGGIVGALQRNEYLRYQRDMALHEDRVMVLSGTASVFRAAALKAVAHERGSTLPGLFGQVYDTAALTEDNELTLALKTLGWRMVSPERCRNVTEVMPTWRDLWKQRERWQRGAIENLRAYGWTSTTRKYWLQQLGIAYGVLSLNLFLLMTVLMVLSVDAVAFSPFWLTLSAAFVLERVVTVWTGGRRARMLAAVLLAEIVYDVFIQAVFVKCVADALIGRSADWHHVEREAMA